MIPIKDESNNPSLKYVLAVLKLSYFDCDTFYKFRDVILDQISTSGYRLVKDTSYVVERVCFNPFYKLQLLIYFI